VISIILHYLGFCEPSKEDMTIGELSEEIMAINGVEALLEP
jgi:hypothetical protein